MPSPALLQAIDRLDKAVSRAETALQESKARARQGAQRREAIITEALGEIDELMSALRENGNG